MKEFLYPPEDDSMKESLIGYFIQILKELLHNASEELLT